jgi:hypothetical protein
VDTQEQAGRPVPQLTHPRQDGWVGLIVLLLALVMVAVLAQTALKRYGLLAPADAPTAKTAVRAQAPDASGQVDAATTTPRNALERARGVENAVRRQADDLGRQIDDTAK